LKEDIRKMEKISPLRASLKAFEQFKVQRKTRSTQQNPGATNPFGLTFKGMMVNMDVFESQASKAQNSSAENKTGSVQDAFKKAGKLAAGAWVSTKASFGSMKQSIISFGNKLKENTISTWEKLNNTNISFTGLFKDSVSNLQKRPVSELETMLKAELEAVKAA